MRGRRWILPSLVLPAVAVGLVHAGLLLSAHRYLQLGLRRTALEILTHAAGLALVWGAAAALVVYLAAVAWSRIRAIESPSARAALSAAGIAVAAVAAARGAWSAARSDLLTGISETGGPAAAILTIFLIAAAPVGLALALRRWRAARVLATALMIATGIGWAAGWAARALLPTERGPDRPNVLLVSLDTLRADRVGCYGYSRPTTPGLDALAAEGAIFQAATTPAPWTLPSHASMLTGLYPHHHGAVRPRSLLPAGALTIPERLREAGYRTGALTGGGHLSRRFGFSQGFHSYEELGHAETEETVSRAIRWLEERDPAAPFFLFVHTYETHMPYRDRSFADPADSGSIGPSFERDDLLRLRNDRWEPTPGERRYISDLYDGDARATDEGLRRLWSWLEVRGEMDRTLVIVVSDHGEELFERGSRRSVRHGHTLYDELIRIPLIVRYPPLFGGGRRIRSPASLVDLAPTIAAAAGLPWPAPTDGIDLALLAAGSGPAREAVLSEALGSGAQRRALRASRYKYIVPVEPGGAPVELYDLEEDPGETANLADALPDVAAAFAAGMESLDPFGGGNSDATIDPELEERLRALGYIE